MARLYKEYLKLFEAWPLDLSKKGDRDFAFFLRNLVKEQFGSNKKITPDEEIQYTKNLNSLKRIAADTYLKKYPRIKTYSATGLNKQECSILLSQEVLDSFKSKGFFSSFFEGKEKDESVPKK